MDNTAEQNAANFSGHEEEQEEEQDSQWSSITEKNIQQVNLWGNLPDIKHPKDVKPLSGEEDLDQVSLNQRFFFHQRSFST